MLQELGRLVYDVEVKEVGEGKKVLNNRLAIQNGKDNSTFIDIVAWDKDAEHIGKYYKKGYEILLEGKLINVQRQKKKDNITVEFESVAILVDRVRFTYGNPREGRLEDVPDFL